MKNVFKKNGESGFSLVELMIVVGIIGVLATLALPRFKQFQAKAKMGEAKNMLSHLYTLEQTYSLDNNTFIAMGAVGAGDSPRGNTACQNIAGQNELGFKIDPCQGNHPTPRFYYDVTNVTTSTFTARAQTRANANNRVCPGNPAFTIALDQANVIADVNVGQVCPN